jgi:hypothetical protein
MRTTKSSSAGQDMCGTPTQVIGIRAQDPAYRLTRRSRRLQAEEQTRPRSRQVREPQASTIDS